MDSQQTDLEEQDNSNVPGGTPAFFVILKQPQGNGTSEQGILVANHDSCAVPSSVPAHTLVKPQTKSCLPADCNSGDITVTLDNNSMWNEFYRRNTEMILTKQGRRMFPYCRYWITGLNFYSKYILVMDISPVDNHRYKWNGRWWELIGKAEPHVLGRVFIHPESPSTGQYWMHQPVSFYKLKLTNNTLDQEGHIILHTMHRYLPRLHLVPVEKATEVIQLNGPGVHTFTFPQTEFFAVTAYQNIQITQLKIDYNPFAKGFRDDGLSNRPVREMHPKSSSDQEGGSVSSSPSNHGFLESDWLDAQQRSQVSSFSTPDQLDIDMERESFNAERDFLNFLDPNFPVENTVRMKQEVSESPVDSSFEDSSHAPSPLDPNGHFSVVIKEEPLDDYDYEANMCMKGVTVKQEDSEEEVTDEYSNSDNDYPILERQFRRMPFHEPTKRPLTSPTGVAKAKMLKLDSEKLPVVYLESCSVAKSTGNVSELPQTIFSTCRKEPPPVTVASDALPGFSEERPSFLSMSTITEKEKSIKTSHKNKGQQKLSSSKEPQVKNNEDSQDTSTPKTPCLVPRSSADDLFSTKDISRRNKPVPILPKSLISPKGMDISQNTIASASTKRGRPRKLKISKTGRRSKRSLGKPVETFENALTGVSTSIPDIKPDLEDVDGVLFVSFASKEALDIHTTDRIVNEEPLNLQIHQVAAEESEELGRIIQLEKDLLVDLKCLRHKQVIHPALQEVGLKLSFVDPTVSIDLKYLGVQLPLPYYKRHTTWNSCSSPGALDAGFPFVSRTGKTNDFTKIKGWRDKFTTSSVASGSKTEGNNLEASLKNRSAFCSDKLDEYLENEGKLMEACMGISPSSSVSPVTYQLPTKSTSYVRTLDSVLKKQSTPAQSSTLKPLSMPSAQKKGKASGKASTPHTKAKPSYKPILPSPITVKQKPIQLPTVEKTTKTQSTTQSSLLDKFIVPALDENMLPKQISLRQAQQYPQPGRPPGLSKSQLKLMDLEDCAVWDGKTRTYITEERADISLATLLTAQASLKNKPIHKIIRRRAPPCNNDFCRLGCVCASLSQEKRQPTHCRRPECMFGCSCLKRKVLLVKGSKPKKIMKKTVDRNLVLYGAIEEPSLHQEKKEEESRGHAISTGDVMPKKKNKLEYICDAEPEQPVGSYRIWEQAEGEVDSEPIYIPPSAIEPVKPVLSSYPEMPSSVKCKSVSGAKQGRIYSPKPNPVIRDEDKDPIYRYFESLMTCARVRAYERKSEEQRQRQQLVLCDYNSKLGRDHNFELKPKKGARDTERETDKSENDLKLFRSGTDIFSSVTHQEVPTKLIEIVSDCSWEEDGGKILSILPQHMNNSVPQSLKVGNLTIELASEHKPCDEQTASLYSRVKISMPSYQGKDDDGEKSVSDIPSPCAASHKREETVKFLRTENTDQLLEKLHGGKGLPFYTGLSPAGRLVAYKCKPNLNPSGLIQVNGKSYPQAKLLLGQMGALHPANRLAAYITGRLRPTVLDISTLSTVISKVASNAASVKTTASDFSTSTTISDSMKPALTNSNVRAQRPIAAWPSSDGVFTQFVMNRVGSLQQVIPGVSTPQPLTGSQKFSIKPASFVVVTPVSSSKLSQAFCTTTSTEASTLSTQSPTLSSPTFTANPSVSLGSTMVSLPSIITSSNSALKEITHSPPGIAIVASSEETTTNSTATVTSTIAFTNSTKATVVSTSTTPVTSLTSISFPKSTVITSGITLPVSTTTSTIVMTTTASSLVTTSPSSMSGSSFGSIPVVLSGINTSSNLSQRPEEAAPQTCVQVSSPQVLSPGTERRPGPRLLLIPVQSNSTAVRPVQNVQLAQGQRMILQPLRNPGGVNLFRHPNGQVIQLVPLQQLRASRAQPNIQQVMFHNPGSVMGIRLPLPTKATDASSSPTVPALSTVSGSSSTTTTTISVSVQNIGTTTTMTTTTSPVSSVPSFLSQAGTLTLRISPPGANNLSPSHTGSESRMIAYNSGGQPMGTASIIPLQSGGFALLQLPGQKTVPSSILNHVAALQLKKDSQTSSHKGDTCQRVKQFEENTSLPESEEVIDLKVTESDGKQVEQLSLNQLSSDEEISSIKKSDQDCDSLQELISESDPINEISTLEKNISATVVSSDHSYTSDKKVVPKKLKLVLKDLDPVSKASDLTLPEKAAQLERTISSADLSDIENQTNIEPRSSEPQKNGAQPESPRPQENDVQSTSPMKFVNNEQPETWEKKGDTCEKEFVLWPDEKNEDITQPKDLEWKADTVQLESLGKEKNKFEIDHTKESDNVECSDLVSRISGDEERPKSNLKQCLTGFQNKIDASDISSSLSRNSQYAILNLTATSEIGSSNSNESSRKAHRSAGHSIYFHDPKNKTQELLKQNKKIVQETVVITMEDEEKTDDSADELMEEFQSEEEVDVEKIIDSFERSREIKKNKHRVRGGLLINGKNDSGSSSEDDEQVDIETVEELSEKINIARLKATATHIRSSKEQYKVHNSDAEKGPEKVPKRNTAWNKKYRSEEDAFAYYRQTHTANERRRRNEMRDLFEKLKTALGLHNLTKVSKCYILKQAYEEIQGLTDQADKLIGQKNLLTRKQDMLIRKVSGLSGKTEEVVLKKLEYIYAKQKALEAEKKRKLLEDDESSNSFSSIRQLQNESYSPPEESRQILMPSKRGKPLILSRKTLQGIKETPASSVSLTTASLVMTPQGQVLTLKSPLMPAQVTAVPSAIQQVELAPQTPSNTTSQPGVTSVVIQLPNSTVPLQVKGFLTNSAIPITLSAVPTSAIVSSPMVTGTKPTTDCEDLFMMPKIVNVTSLATETGLNLQATPMTVDTSATAPSKLAKRTTRKCEDAAKKEGKNDQLAPLSGVSVGPTQILLEDKELAFPDMLKVASTVDSSESGFLEKLGIGEIGESQSQGKETNGGTERLKVKDSPFRRLKDSRIEVELRKVASAIEEADLDPSDLMGSIEDHDDTDETLTSLLNEIAFLNQQLNNDNSSLSVSPDFSQGDLELHRGASSELDAGDAASFQFGNFKSFSDARESSGSISPLLLHLEDDELHDHQKHLEQPSSQPSILKLVMGSEKEGISTVSDGKKKTKDLLAEAGRLSCTPVLQMKANQETSGTDSLWRPMPKLAPLGLKAAHLPADQEGQSTKVMPSLAPVVLKLGPVGVRSTEKEEESTRVMPVLSPVTAPNSSGTLPLSTAGK
ncbi:MAX gene-associated protein isoform X2 [Rhinatrema bivittatum]|uniref:MAX gene-associated protein isoform X2 n=1 Tax=Rhinatrema bivittatum TaxID=194408 RepID=UPI00112B7BBB|nr:MAX gene-associated protein isoform X2 [Rhinatrema bivittatum]